MPAKGVCFVTAPVRDLGGGRTIPRIHCVTEVPADRVAYLDLLARIVVTGVDAVQIRAEQLSDDELFEFSVACVDRLKPLGATVIVNDRVDIALASGADGVHLGLTDLPVAAARRIAPDLLVGATCRNAEHARAALRVGADYVGVGPVFPTDSKAGLPDLLAPEVVRAVAQTIPAVAIAGITAPRIPRLLALGVHGVAVIGAISRAPDPVGAAADIVGAVRAAAHR